MKLPDAERQGYKRYLENLHYEASMAHTYRADQEFAERKLRAEGRAEEKQATARKMLADGLDVTVIARYTGLTAEEIAALAQAETHPE